MQHAKPEETVVVRLYDSHGVLAPPARAPRVVKTEADWRALLTPEQYRITREHDTERAFCGVFYDHKQAGVYFCVCCDLPLFRSDAKFDSGTGWPSFFQPVADENVATREDRSYGMVRREILCRRCDAHLGHVFDDGPPPTGLRYCLNSASLEFRAATPAHEGGAAPAAKTQLATFGAGCFWGVEATFRKMPGVLDAAVGYEGGTLERPTYHDVCTDETGHAEVVQVEFDPRRTSYDALLDVFFSNHNPTTLNRQGPDVGSQYRSVVFFHDDEQRRLAEAKKAALDASGRFPRRIVTEIAPATTFWRAEEYHQRYLEKRGLDACHDG